jgi:hypothetical protein
VTDAFILKGINGASIRNEFECHVGRVTEIIGPREKFSTSCVSLNSHISKTMSPYESGNASKFNSASAREIRASIRPPLPKIWPFCSKKSDFQYLQQPLGGAFWWKGDFSAFLFCVETKTLSVL